MSRISILVNWVLVGAIVSLLSTSEAAKSKAPMKFIPANNSSMLQVSKGISITVYKMEDKTKTVVTNATFELTNETKITGSDNCTYGADCPLTIEFNDPDQIKLILIMKYDQNHIDRYWEWTSLTIEGKIKDQAIDPTKNGNMIVTPRPGYTKRKADVNCQRDNTICAPLTLSWTCNDEEFKSSNSLYENFVGIKFPGLQLQPFFKDNSKTQRLRFGANWDCDPLLSVPIWVGLLTGLGLIMALYWGIDMISSLHTPDRFDDPKGKPIMVPTTD